MMKKHLTAILVAVMLVLSAIAFVGCSKQISTGVLQTVAISNKTELTADWFIGDADRTVAVNFTPDSFTVDNTAITVTSDNRNVVAVDGMKLKAVGVGKAVVTVEAEGKTDTVELKVARALSGVAITNKAELTTPWYLGDDPREVTIKLTPDEYTLANTVVTVTSDNTDVITVGANNMLTAVAVGKSKITVSAGGFTDEVEITVSNEELVGISLNEAALKAPWTVGDADREVVVTYDPAGVYNEENTPYTITSGNPEAVTVIDNKKLHAVALGEAEITVSAGGKTAKLTVNVRPALISVAISNKTALQAKWVIGDAARTVEVGFDPSAYYTADNTTAEIESSNKQAIIVSGKTLTAVGVGKSTITVTVGDKTDEVELEVVRPALNSLSITSDKTLNWTLTGSNSATIAVSFDPAQYYGANDVTATASGDDIVTVNGLTITANGKVGTATITVAYKGDGNIKDTLTVATAVSNPSAEFNGNNITLIESGEKQGQYAVNGLHGAAIALPTVNKAACDNRDDNVTVETVLSDPAKMTVESGNLTVSEKGDYTVTYKVTDRRDTTKMVSYILNVSVYRKLIGKIKEGDGSIDSPDYHFKDGKAFVADDEQVVVCTNPGISRSPFNFAPSKYYYAEATFRVSDLFENVWDSAVGLGHFKQVGDGQFLASLVTHLGSLKVKPFNINSGDANEFNLNENNEESIIYSYNIGTLRGFAFDKQTVKYAVARIGDDFYTFINDKYACNTSFKQFRDIDTVPGIFANGWYEGNQNRAEASNIRCLFDTQDNKAATNKVNELLNGSKIVGAYRPSDMYADTTGKITLSQDNIGYTYNATDTDFNNGAVSPYVYFDGDFTFEYEYKPNQFDWSVWEAGSILVIRSNKYGNEMVRFGVDFAYSDDKEGSRFIADVPKAGGGFNYHQDTRRFKGDAVEQNGKSYKPADDIFAYGAKFRVTRTITNGKATFAYNVFVYTDNNKTVGYTWNWTFTDISEDYGEAWNDCTKTVQMIWHNRNTSGTYSNIRWAYTATPDWN